MTDNMMTIFALSSAAGKAGVSVIRVSGPKAWDSLKVLASSAKLPAARKTSVISLRHPGTGTEIDQAMVVGFKSPASFTGEDVIEYHCHGSPAVLDELIDVLGGMSDHRLAQHGEFTRRAFDNGKLDLTEAEAIADLIDAETKTQKEQALAQMGGSLSTLYSGWAKDLTKSLAYIETIIDFPDEDVPDEETAKAFPAIQNLIVKIEHHLNDNRRGERLRNGLEIAVIGAPNAGKSSLVNALAQRDVAIVSEMAGTTRDIIEVHLNLGGYPVIISDTAGLRPDQISGAGHDAIELEGIKRALQKAEEADLRILLFDGTASTLDPHTLKLINKDQMVVVNKVDLNPDVKNVVSFHENISPLFISTETSEGLDAFIDSLAEKISSLMKVSRETPSLTRQRHRHHLEDCLSFLHASINQTQPELIAQELRSGINELGRITGRVDVEDLLDVIFRDFCIGK